MFFFYYKNDVKTFQRESVSEDLFLVELTL